ncbi:hypothetical protein I5677_03640 [Mobilitalea sibirica]|uniref:Uncharacterized protein n=1 Tax=Mobilitalea sibirica TaxID=1462919 RepID=A0A8J7H136_9FIRM|nr:permease prefix domain 1-containing protein [Mobilitalea sibirica]MBH1939988.1 hypothetical protein [Mobilitalea sibirica]
MDEKLRRYVEGLFVDVPQNKSMIELKEEMIQNLKEKYEDLIQEGKTEEAAYNIAIAGIGDISELINDLDKTKEEAGNTDKQKSAMLTSVAVMLYILSIVPILLSLQSYHIFDGLIGFIVIITFATGILIYNGQIKQKYYRADDTMVEEFKEWQKKRADKTKARISISVALWSIIVALYFIISFSTFAWHISWTIFILGIAIEALINIFFIIKK